MELTTPTGIAMLANLAHIFSPIYPEMIPDKVGYGAGRRQLISSPNLLRIVLGTREDSIMNEVIDMLETNLDDVSGEVLAHTLQRLIDSGAKDAWLTAAQFKKNRPGTCVTRVMYSTGHGKILKNNNGRNWNSWSQTSTMESFHLR